MSIWIKIILRVLFWVFVGGMGFNYIMRFISYSFYKRAKQNGEMEETVQKIEIDNGLIGYVSGINFHEKKKAILYFGGSGEIAYNAVFSYAKLFNDYVFACVDYKGTQESKGRMNLKTMQESALLLYDYIIKQDYVDTSHLVIMGYSYGTGIATYLASKRTCAKIVLIAGYRDICDLYNRIIPVFHGPVRIFVTDNIDAKTYATHIQTETLLITSDGDKTINKKIPQELSKYFKNAILKEFKGINHADYWKHQEVVLYIREFIDN
ncbi:MAG: alpha/beta hydrolase family protein [Sporolactobacillus sp.]